MSWNHRVMQKSKDGEITQAIFEVYYDENGDAWRWDSDPVAPFYSTEIDEDWSLRDDYNRLGKAFDRPVLDHETGKPVQTEEPTCR